MDVHANSSGLQHVVGYGPHSVVLAYPNHHHHQHNNHRHHYHSLPPRSLPKATTSYELVPLVPVMPTTIYMPVEQKKQQQQHHHQPSQGNYHRSLDVFKFCFSFSVIKDPFLAEQYLPSKLFKNIK